MGVTKQQITPGNGTDKPKAGDTITMEYTGNLYDENAANKKGDQSALSLRSSIPGECSLRKQIRLLRWAR